MIIDKAVPADARTIAGIHWTARHKAMPWLPVLHTEEQVFWYFNTMVLPVEKVLIAREGAHAVGFISVHQGWLTHLYIAPDRWGTGFGTSLLDAAKSGLDCLHLRVFQKNERARHFYSRHGFCEHELGDGQNNEEKVPDIRMVWVRGA